MSGVMFDLVKSMLRKIFGGGSTVAIAEVMFIDVTSASFQNTWSKICDTYDTYVVPVGIAVLMFLFFYDMVEKSSTTDMSYEIIGKSLCKMLLLCAFMEISLSLALLMMQIGSLVTHFLSASLSDVAASEAAVTACIKVFFYTEYPVWNGILPFIDEFSDCFLPLFILSIPWLVTVICELVVKLIALMRHMEIFARATFFPIAIGDSYGGMSSSGVRYMKTFLALCLQSAVVIALMRISDFVCIEYMKIIDIDTIADVDSILAIVIMPLMLRVITTALVLKSFPLAKEICGAH